MRKEITMSLLNPIEETPFYKTTWFIVIALFVFAPVGLFLMWLSDDWEKKTKIIVTLAVVALSIAWWVGR
jgi:hypothetical protein